MSGLRQPVEILRDRWGVPHIFAASDEDAYYALGFVHAQDRLFQMELGRHVAQGRLAELFGRDGLKADRLFRTLDLFGVARRMVARARPEARAALQAYTRGVNASVAALHGRLPPEFALLRRGFEPARDDDFVGVVGYMAWGLSFAWHFDPLYEKLVARVGPERAAELFPYNFGGTPSVIPPGSAPPPPGAVTAVASAPRRAAESWSPKLALFDFEPRERELLRSLPSLRASNNWVIGPSRSASGHPMLANDPHLAHRLPGTWYEAHLKTPTLDVMGVTLAGLPLVIIGHNRDVAWGFTNTMLDQADFFVEQVDPQRPDRVMSRGSWTKIEEREELIQVRGAAPERLVVRSTPHGPIVGDLLAAGKDARPDAARVLSFRWTYAAADRSNDLDGFFDLNRARDWDSFRAALSRFGAIAQNAVYADREGHFGLQVTGAIPRLQGEPDGSAPRAGWDGSQDWDGFRPFDENPWVKDPPEGFLVSANNPTFAPPAPYYVSSHWEPIDRAARIRELLSAKPKLTLEDMQAIQRDTTLHAARELTPPLLAAFEGRPPDDPLVEAALHLLRGWDGRMSSDSPAPALFAAFYRRLFWEMFEDEFGPQVAKGYRAEANLSATMMRAAFERGLEHWFDRKGTPAVEDRGQVLRDAFARAVRELREQLGGAPGEWSWGRLHTLELRHPLGRLARPLRWYFNRGPFPMPGHTSTVNKMEFPEEDFRVTDGPSMRQITDLADLDRALAVLPAGQSGIPASPHYDDLLPLWLRGEYHPFPISRAAIEPLTEARLVLEPAP